MAFSPHLVPGLERGGDKTLHRLIIKLSEASPASAGVESVDIDLKEQKVIVMGNVQEGDVVQTVSKTGKTTELWK